MAGLPPGLEVPPGYEDVEPSPRPLNGASSAWDQGQQNGNQLEDAAEEDIKVTPAQGTIYKAAESFKDLGLHPNLLRGLYDEMNFETPSKIQAQVLPLVLERSYKSLIAQAHNGSGKTTCFVLAMLSRVDPAQRTPQTLCLCPTRELVVQNVMVTQKMGRHTGVQVESTADESVIPRRGDKCQAQIVIATHGKLKNWLARDFIPLNHMKILVFDEADQMLAKDGFGQESLRMIKRVQSATTGLQILLFSATFNQAVIDFAKDVVGTEAHQVYVPKEELSLDVIKQYRVEVDRPRQKIDVITKMIFPNSEKLGQTIIFVKTRDTARALFTELTRQGHKVTNITGDMEKRDRDNIVDEFRTGKTKILIATDLLARGFDVRSVTLVVNFDAPVVHGSGHNPQPNFETYLHRIGRSGRFGQKGCAFNLVCEPSEKAVVDAIAEHFKKEIPEVKWDDEEAFIHCLEEAGLKSAEDAY